MKKLFLSSKLAAPMKKLMKTLLTACIALMPILAFSSPQLPNWYLFRNSTPGQVIRFLPSGPYDYTTIPQPLDEYGVPITNYSATNAMYDNDGKLLFYVVVTEVTSGPNVFERGYFYDASGNKMEDNFGNSFFSNFESKPLVKVREISIIPTTCSKYHVIMGEFILEIDLVNNQWKPKTTFDSGISGYGPGLNIHGYAGPAFDFSTLPMAIGHVNPTDYTIFFLTGNNSGSGGNRRLISTQVSKNDGSIISSYSYDIQTIINYQPLANYTTQFTNAVTELEVSPDGKLLSFADDNYIFIINLNANGSVNLTTPVKNAFTYLFNANTLDTKVAGIEFNSSSDKLVFNRYDFKTAPNNTSEVGIWDFKNNVTPQFITNSSDYAHSQIELGGDGNLYAVSAFDFAMIDIPSATIQSVFSGGTDLNNELNASGIDCRVRTMPDQIDGYTINATAFELNSLNVTTSGTWNPGTTGNPFGSSGELNVLYQIVVKSGTSLIVNDFTFNFFTNAQLIVETGATLQLFHCTLKGHECGLMWKGIKVMNGGELLISGNQSLQTSAIRDAVIGVDITGTNAWTIINGYTYFTGNETDVRITNGNRSNIELFRLTMDGATPLRDQNYGSANGYLDNLNRTIYNIELIDCASRIRIGYPGFQGCALSSAQIGIHAVRSSAEVVRNTFTYHMVYGIQGDAQRQAQRQIDINNNTFTKVQQPIRLENGIHTITQSNTFNTSYEYGIHYLGNNGCKAIIGSLTDPTLGNSFDNCNWVAINFFDNVDHEKTEIAIANNHISNHLYATGVSVAEYAVPTGNSSSYASMHITRNTITNMGSGIKVSNVVGLNTRFTSLQGPTPHDNNFDKFTTIDSNTVNFVTDLYPHNQIGIQTSNSSKLNIINNIVFSNNPSDWRNVGIQTDDATFTSIFQNESSAGCGLRIGGNMRLANAYCNYIHDCNDGLVLNYASLRDLGELHGILNGQTNSQARDNSISNIASGFQMRLYYSTDVNNKWVINGILPTVDYTYATGTPPFSINGGTGANVCQSNFSSGSDPSGGGNVIAIPSTAPTITSTSAAKHKVNPGSQHVNVGADNIRVFKTSIKQAKDSIGRKNTSAPNFFSQMAVCDEMILRKSYDSAFQQLKLVSPADTLQREMLLVYQMITEKLHQKRSYRSGELDTLTKIAQKHQFKGSPVAALARVIIKQERHLDIQDSVEDYPIIIGQVAPCNLNNLADIKVRLLTSSGLESGFVAYTDSFGIFVFDCFDLRMLNSTANYTFVATLPNQAFASCQPKKLGTFTAMRPVVLNCFVPQMKTNAAVDTTSSLASVEDALKVYPNPTTGVLTVTCKSGARLTVVDLLGRTVYESNAEIDHPQLNLNFLPKGLYSINIQDERSHTTSFIIE